LDWFYIYYNRYFISYKYIKVLKNKIKEEINKNYPELTSIQKENLYKTLLQTELHWKKGGKKWL